MLPIHVYHWSVTLTTFDHWLRRKQHTCCKCIAQSYIPPDHWPWYLTAVPPTIPPHVPASNPGPSQVALQPSTNQPPSSKKRKKCIKSSCDDQDIGTNNAGMRLILPRLAVLELDDDMFNTAFHNPTLLHYTQLH